MHVSVGTFVRMLSVWVHMSVCMRVAVYVHNSQVQCAIIRCVEHGAGECHAHMLAAWQVFRDIAAASGQNSQERKKGLIIKLLAASKGNEAGYIMRSLQVG